MAEGIEATPPIPATCQWSTFLRNHDEVDLGRLTHEERQEVFARFGPDESMQLYGRGIRRRLAPMLGNNRRRLEMAYALQFALPGTPVLRYGEELGMGDDLSLEERNAIRTPMQWSDEPNLLLGSSAKKQVSEVSSVDDGGHGWRREPLRFRRGRAIVVVRSTRSR